MPIRTVGELKAILEQYPVDTPLMMHDCCGCCYRTEPVINLNGIELEAFVSGSKYGQEDGEYYPVDYTTGKRQIQMGHTPRMFLNLNKLTTPEHLRVDVSSPK